MIEQACDPAADGATALVVLPNRSLTRNGLFWFAALQTSAMLAVAIYSATHGNVFAPPFALFEAALVAFCLRLAWLRSGGGEVISLSMAAVEITRLGTNAMLLARFNPYWLRVNLQRGARRNSPSRLWLESHGRRLEVGAFLSDDERKLLAERLKNWVAGATVTGAAGRDNR